MSRLIPNEPTEPVPEELYAELESLDRLSSEDPLPEWYDDLDNLPPGWYY